MLTHVLMLCKANIRYLLEQVDNVKNRLFDFFICFKNSQILTSLNHQIKLQQPYVNKSIKDVYLNLK